jgi:hypothetical protein
VPRKYKNCVFRSHKNYQARFRPPLPPFSLLFFLCWSHPFILCTHSTDAMHFSDFVFCIALASVVSAGVVDRRAAFSLKNGQDAQALNKKFQTLTPNSPCTSGEEACVNNQLAQCVGNKFALTSCSATLQCVAVPLVNKPGTRCVIT